MKTIPYKLLIVEDDPSVLTILTLAFRGDKYQVFTAGTMAEAGEKLRTNRADLIILDRLLPDGDGIEFCAEIRKDPHYLSLPILMLTGKAETGDKVLGLKLGADDYLTKPFEVQELRARVEVLLRRTDELNIRRAIKRSMNP